MTRSHNRPEDHSRILDELFRALNHPIRRRILMAMMEHNPRTSGEFETERVVPDEASDRVEIELHHHHLPHLDREGFIDWDPDSDTITRGPRFEEIQPLLKVPYDHRDDLPYDWT